MGHGSQEAIPCSLARGSAPFLPTITAFPLDPEKDFTCFYETYVRLPSEEEEEALASAALGTLPLVQVDRVSLEWMVGKFPPLRYSFLRQGQEAGFGGQYRNCVGMMAVPDAGDVRTGSVHG